MTTILKEYDIKTLLIIKKIPSKKKKYNILTIFNFIENVMNYHIKIVTKIQLWF